MKLVVLGGGAVGKSCITLQYVKNRFIEEYDPTIEEAYSKDVTLDNKQIALQVLDTAGQEEFAGFRANALKNGEGFIVVFSIVDMKSFSEVRNIISLIQRRHADSPKPIVLVGNKCDLASSRTVSETEAQKLAAEFSNMKYFETSAQDNINIHEMFESIMRQTLATKQPTSGSKKGPKCTIL
jgi:small GTP-binding protein